jgi:hypothetical protein
LCSRKPSTIIGIPVIRSLHVRINLIIPQHGEAGLLLSSSPLYHMPRHNVMPDPRFCATGKRRQIVSISPACPASRHTISFCILFTYFSCLAAISFLFHRSAGSSTVPTRYCPSLVHSIFANRICSIPFHTPSGRFPASFILRYSEKRFGASTRHRCRSLSLSITPKNR